MANTLADSYTLSQDSSFRSRVAVASAKACNAALAGTDTSQFTLAKQILLDPNTYTPLIAMMIQSDANIAAGAPTGTSITDAQIQTAVNTYLKNLAR